MPVVPLYNTGTISKIESSVYSGNTAGTDGGAIWNGGTIDELQTSTLNSNPAGGDGGAIYNAVNDTITKLSESIFTGNTAGSGDGNAIFSALGGFLDPGSSPGRNDLGNAVWSLGMRTPSGASGTVGFCRSGSYRRYSRSEMKGTGEGPSPIRYVELRMNANY